MKSLDLLYNYSQTTLRPKDIHQPVLYAFIREVIQKTITFQIIYRPNSSNSMIFMI